MKSKGLIIIPLTIFLLMLSTVVGLSATFVHQRRLSLNHIEEVQRSLDEKHHQQTRGKLSWRVIWSSKKSANKEKKKLISADFGGP